MSERNNRTTWQQAYHLRAHEAGPNGLLRADVLCDYLQDAAANHASVLHLGAEQLEGDGLTWVLARMVMEVDQYPRWPGALRVETWPSGRQGIFATRDFVVSSGQDVLARATTAWFLIDIRRRKPARLPERVTSIDLPERPRALEDDFGRVPRIATGTEPVSTRVAGFSEVDMNRHVNHVRYLAWATDSMPAAWLTEHSVRRLEMQFKNEALAEQQIAILNAPAAGTDSGWLYEIQTAEGALVAQARIDWRKTTAK
ncbi:MAG: medium-chain acyl-[acyl-carrier-protein] hydrolase [Rhodothermales bacterium]|jgi:medium-chain acyl-[acyl-carrier-protein] hydrolase